MELKSLCDICTKPCEPSICWKCGKKVCKEHYDHGSGLCEMCKKGHRKQLGGGQQLVIPESEKPTTVNPGDVKK